MDYHDYGNGFYCTEDLEATKEWACQHENAAKAYVYAYDLNMEALSFLDMSTLEPIYWLSALAQYRFGISEPNPRRVRRQAFINAFPVNCELFDVIRGWRADDRYFAYLKYFLNSDISYEAVVQAIKLGDLGQQIVIKGKKAYSQLSQSGDRVEIGGKEYANYSQQYIERERIANEELQEVRDIPGRLLSDIMVKGGV